MTNLSTIISNLATLLIAAVPGATVYYDNNNQSTNSNSPFPFFEINIAGKTPDAVYPFSTISVSITYNYISTNSRLSIESLEEKQVNDKLIKQVLVNWSQTNQFGPMSNVGTNYVSDSDSISGKELHKLYFMFDILIKDM